MGLLFYFYTLKFVILKKLVSILLLTILLLNSSEFDQLVKLPALFSHFIEHRQLDNQLSFVSFIKEHYQSNADQSDSKHHDLPFKSHECQSINQILVLDTHHTNVTLVYAQIEDEKFELIPDFYNSERVASIWQPPQA